MDEIILTTGRTPQILITSQGKLYIKGWDRDEVRINVSGKDNFTAQQEDETVTVQSLSHCEMRVPYEASVTVQAANGETVLKSVTGTLTIQHANGSVTLNDIGTTLIEDVNRDLNAHEIHGDLTIHHANRFVNVGYVSGNFAAESIAAHLTLKKVEGNISARVQGHATLSLDPHPGQTCNVEAHGVLTCHIPPQANVTLELNGPGPLVTQFGGKTETAQRHLSATLGDGSAQVTLTGYAPVTVLEREAGKTSQEFNFDFGDLDLEMDTLSQQISRQVSEQLEMQMGVLDAQMDALMNTGNLSQEKAEQIRARTQEKLNRAQEKISHAQERAAQKIEKARQRAESKTGNDFTYGGIDAAREGVRTGMDAAREGVRVGMSAAREALSGVFGPSGSRPTRQTSDPVSDQERMMILNMLSEKKISIEEAETLLAALEGRPQ